MRLHYTLVKVTLAADIDDNDTTITFESPLREYGSTNIATISAPNILVLRCGYEILHVTAYTSGASSATVLRGQEGSTATAHTDGDILRHVYTADDLPDLSAYAPLADPTFTGEPTAPSFEATGKTGATATPIRLAGGTAAGAPASGAHLKGEIVFDDAGVGYYCTVAGTPGTWVSFGGGGGGGDIATDTIWNTKGDLAAATGADAAAILAAAANGGILTTDSAQATGLKYITRAVLAADAAFTGAFAPLARVAYNPVSLADYTTTSTSDADLDATNLAVTFTVPPSGVVFITLEALVGMDTATCSLAWCLREASSTVTGTKARVMLLGTTALNQRRCSLTVAVAGLTPGASKTYKWGHARDAGSGTPHTYVGDVAGPAAMLVVPGI